MKITKMSRRERGRRRRSCCCSFGAIVITGATLSAIYNRKGEDDELTEEEEEEEEGLCHSVRKMIDQITDKNGRCYPPLIISTLLNFILIQLDSFRKIFQEEIFSVK